MKGKRKTILAEKNVYFSHERVVPVHISKEGLDRQRHTLVYLCHYPHFKWKFRIRSHKLSLTHALWKKGLKYFLFSWRKKSTSEGPKQLVPLLFVFFLMLYSDAPLGRVWMSHFGLWSITLIRCMINNYHDEQIIVPNSFVTFFTEFMRLHKSTFGKTAKFTLPTLFWRVIYECWRIILERICCSMLKPLENKYEMILAHQFQVNWFYFCFWNFGIQKGTDKIPHWCACKFICILDGYTNVKVLPD